MRVDRRGFLKIVGLGTTATAVSGCSLQGIGTALQLTEQEIRPEPGPESWVASTCGLCPGGCGVVVRKIGERAVKLEGNPIHPVNRGRLCPVGQASLQLLYNPDRLRAPAKRVGERGSGKWQQINWDEAMALMASKLKDLRGQGKPHTLVVLSGQGSELADLLMRRFLNSYGSPNFFPANSEEPSSLAQYITQGIKGRVAYDFEDSNYILSFAAPLVEGWLSPVRQMRALANVRQGRPGYRGKLVQIESRLSATGAKADEWIPVRPGTVGVLALGFAHVIVREDLYDRAFAEKYLAGFEGFKTLVLEQYAPQKVSEVTGVPAEVIERLALEFARSGPSLALAGDGLLQQGNATRSAVAIHALNALIGNIDRPGGVLVRQQPPLSSWPAVQQGEIAASGLGRPSLQISSDRNVSEAILEEKPYKTNALFILGANPLWSAPASFHAALKKVPFVVSFSLFPDETAEQADLILPDCTPLERWDIQTQIPGFALNAVGVGQPAVPPLYQSRPVAEVVIDLAKALGGDISASVPWKGTMEAVQALLMGLYRTKRGLIFTEEFQEEHLRHQLREWDWVPQDYPTFEDFWKDIITKGGWVDPYYRYGDYRRTLRTPSGKFDLSSLLTGGSASSKGDEGFPFFLHIFRPLAFMNEAAANLPFLQEIAGSYVHSPWNSWAEINPKSAKQLGIKDGDWVFIESLTSKIKTRARLFSGAMPDVLSIPLGEGHTALGRWAKNRGVNPHRLFDGTKPTKVRIYKAA